MSPSSSATISPPYFTCTDGEIDGMLSPAWVWWEYYKLQGFFQASCSAATKKEVETSSLIVYLQFCVQQGQR